ncbi:hypothetical protein B566_EDAN008811 [Ephemera danica]|nr:hypothetical protein B566_EDAN008811 [Ephemera danica]
MLQFWKKGASKVRGNQKSSLQGSRSNSTESTSSQNQAFVNGVSTPDEPGSVGPLRGFHHEELLIGDLGSSECNDQNHRLKSSKLSKSLREVLADKGALGYFIQYMEARQRVGYIKFWLDAESFCAATNCLKLSPVEEFHESSVPWAISREILEGSVAADAASLTSTEDGSVSPLVETARTDACMNECSNTKVQKRSETEVNEEILICSRAESLSRDSLLDAVRIYQKYLSASAPRKQSVQVPEAIRLSTVDQICREDGRVDPECFASAQQYVYEMMEKE